jgi:hypothetical protein
MKELKGRKSLIDSPFFSGKVFSSCSSCCLEKLKQDLDCVCKYIYWIKKVCRISSTVFEEGI